MSDPTKSPDPLAPGGSAERTKTGAKTGHPPQAVPAADEHTPQNEHDEQLVAEEFAGIDNDLVNVETFSQPAWDDERASPHKEEDRRGLPGEVATEPPATPRKR